MFCSRKINGKINDIHERALRMVYGDYRSSFEELLIRDKTVCIHHRNIQRVAIEIFKIKNNLSPEILKGLFCLTNNDLSNSFGRPNVNSVFNGEYSLRWFGPIVWDSMVPETLKKLTILEEFMGEIKTWVPEKCPCRLCKDYVPKLGFVTLFE